MDGCVFCGIASGSIPAYVVGQTDQAVAFLDARPVFPGHTLVIPRRHWPTLADVPGTHLASYFGFVQKAAVAVETGMDADGTFVAINNKISQSVPHLHAHVIPRRRKDGLRGFFWPRAKYPTEMDARACQDSIKAALATVEAPPR